MEDIRSNYISMRPQTIDEQVGYARVAIKNVGEQVKNLIEQVKNFEASTSDKSEMIANTILAYRHLEDAAMRLGKTIQAYEGGKSIYDNNDAKRVAENGPVAEGFYNKE